MNLGRKMNTIQYSFRSSGDINYENRYRSKKMKKNKYRRSCSEQGRYISKNGTGLNFCRFCRPRLAIRINNKSIIQDEINNYI